MISILRRGIPCAIFHAFGLVVLGALCANAQIGFQGFETNTGDWQPDSCAGTITRVPSGGGVLGRMSYDGNFHAEITNCDNGFAPGYGDSMFGEFDLPPSGTYPGDYAQTISVYIFANKPHGAAAGVPDFWLDMAVRNNTAAINFGSEHNFRFTANGTSVTVQVDNVVAPIATITTSGWYTFQMTYRKDPNPANPVLTDMNVFNQSGLLLGTIVRTATSPGGPLLSANLGGPGYVWFTVWQNGYAGDILAIDDARVDLLNPPGAFQVRYTSNLIVADSVVNITNTGASATANLVGVTPPQNNINGSLCVNIYAFAADEQEVACCSCLVTPNALWSASVKTALLNRTLTPSFPDEVVVKLISTVPNVGAGGVETCNPATISGFPAVPGALVPGLLAWGTTAHGSPTATGPNFSIAETPFAPATLSTAELTRDVQECQFIQVLGSGQFGICKGCSNAGLGAAAQ